jgi:hypothetical protein
MGRNAATFIALGGTAEKVADVLCELIQAECKHSHKAKCQDAIAHSDEDPPECGHTVDLTNLDEVAVVIAEKIEKGELS